jgi:hypothetical protein
MEKLSTLWVGVEEASGACAAISVPILADSLWHD